MHPKIAIWMCIVLSSTWITGLHDFVRAEQISFFAARLRIPAQSGLGVEGIYSKTKFTFGLGINWNACLNNVVSEHWSSWSISRARRNFILERHTACVHNDLWWAQMHADSGDGLESTTIVALNQWCMIFWSVSHAHLFDPCQRRGIFWNDNVDTSSAYLN